MTVQPYNVYYDITQPECTDMHTDMRMCTRWVCATCPWKALVEAVILSTGTDMRTDMRVDMRIDMRIHMRTDSG